MRESDRLQRRWLQSFRGSLMESLVCVLAWMRLPYVVQAYHSASVKVVHCHGPVQDLFVRGMEAGYSAG